MSRPPLPEPWGTALETKGVTTIRGLAARAEIAPQTAKRLIDGEGRPSVETVAAVADALFEGDRDRVWSLAGHGHQDHGDWQLPPEASLLNSEQRAAVVAVVRAMLPAGARHLTGVDSAESKQARRVATEPTVEQVMGAQEARRRRGLSVAGGKVADAVAADEQEQSIAGEQEESDTP